MARPLHPLQYKMGEPLMAKITGVWCRAHICQQPKPGEKLHVFVESKLWPRKCIVSRNDVRPRRK